MTGRTIGDRIRIHRKLRGLSIRQVAGLAGLAQSTWSRIERGERSADNRHVLASIAQALQVSTSDLTGQPPIPTDGASARIASSVHATVQALLDTETDLPPSVANPRPVVALETDAAELQALGLACRVTDSVRRLPGLLRDAHAHIRGPDRAQALRILTVTAHRAFATLKNLGYPAEAWIASDRAHDAARALGDPVMLGFAAWSRGHAATNCGSYQRAVVIALNGIEQLRDCESPEAIQVSRSLHLLAGWAYRGLGRTSDGDTLIAEAGRLAQDVPVPGDDPLGLVFCAPNVGLWRVSAALEAREPGKAVEIAGNVPTGVLPPIRQAAHYVDLGRALADLGDIDRAVRAVLHAERVGPERVRRSPFARETVRGLVHQAHRHGPPGLAGLAERLDITTA